MSPLLFWVIKEKFRNKHNKGSYFYRSHYFCLLFSFLTCSLNLSNAFVLECPIQDPLPDTLYPEVLLMLVLFHLTCTETSIQHNSLICVVPLVPDWNFLKQCLYSWVKGSSARYGFLGTSNKGQCKLLRITSPVSRSSEELDSGGRLTPSECCWC